MTRARRERHSYPDDRACSSYGACAALVLGLSIALVAGCAKETPEGLIRAAEQHIAGHEYRTAQIELRNAIRLAPNSGVGHRLLGTLLAGRDPVAAEAALRRALDLGERPDDVLPALALALIRQGQPDRLTADFGTRKLESPAADASFRTNLGHAWLTLGDVKQSRDAFAAALVTVPHYPLARLGQARPARRAGWRDRRRIDHNQ
jgi:Tfp pilus assembly protein PilF